MNRVLMTSGVIALSLLAASVDAQTTKTASEMYWDAVRASTGPIGFPRATPDDPSRRQLHARRPVFTPGVFAPGMPYIAPPPERVYVPIYVPGPIVYVPVPAAAPPPPASIPSGFGATGASGSSTPAPRTPERFYVIPGCYGGNKPPQRETLPAGCDIRNLRVSTW